MLAGLPRPSESFAIIFDETELYNIDYAEQWLVSSDVSSQHVLLCIRKAHISIISSPVFAITEGRDCHKSYNILWLEVGRCTNSLAPEAYLTI